MTAISAKTFNIFAYGVEKATQVEDKVTTFAKNTFNSIRSFNLQKIRDGFFKAYNFTKENKFTIALAVVSLAISAAVFVKVSATMAILFLGSVSFVKIYAYTRAHVKSADYQFKKLAKDFIRSMENMCRHSKDGKQQSTDLVSGKLEQANYNLQEQLINFMLENIENRDQFNSWIQYLKDLNPNLRLFSDSFPKFTKWKRINDIAFKTQSTSINVRLLIDEIGNFIAPIITAKDQKSFEVKLRNLIKDLDPKSPTLKDDISKKAEEIRCFSTDETKQAIATKLYNEIKASKPATPASSSSSSSSASAAPKPATTSTSSSVAAAPKSAASSSSPAAAPKPAETPVASSAAAAPKPAASSSSSPAASPKPAETPVASPAAVAAPKPAETPVASPAAVAAPKPAETPVASPAAAAAPKPAETPVASSAAYLSQPPPERPIPPTPTSKKGTTSSSSASSSNSASESTPTPSPDSPVVKGLGALARLFSGSSDEAPQE